MDYSPFIEEFLKILLAASCGSIIGLERELSAKPAGLRTNILICVGACMFTILSYAIAAGSAAYDPGRVAAQIVAGIGFLGAGAIIQAKGYVIGLTTAATIWVTASIGMAVGVGMYSLAVATTLVILVILLVFRRIDRWVILHTRQPFYVDIRTNLDVESYQKVLNQVRRWEKSIEQLQIDRSKYFNHLNFTFRDDEDARRAFTETLSSMAEVQRFQMERAGHHTYS